MSSLTKRDRYEGVGLVFTTSREQWIDRNRAQISTRAEARSSKRTYTGLIVSTIAGVMFMARAYEIPGDKPGGHSEVLTPSLGVILTLPLT